MTTTPAAAFTEEAYADLVRSFAARYSFIPFESWNQPSEGHVALWRHDVDFSPQRALALANIEKQLGVTATYFILLTSSFYNAMEKPVHQTISRIQAAGHQLGLHFEPGVLAKHEDWREDLAHQQAMLSQLFGCSIRCFSLHNPTEEMLRELVDDEHAGMVNAYGLRLRQRFVYRSDSNGGWRPRLGPAELLEEGHARVHVLTHPEWWTPEEMYPRERVYRAAFGRAEAAMIDYDRILAESQRVNVTGPLVPPGFLAKREPARSRAYEFLRHHRLFDTLFLDLYRLHKAMFPERSRDPRWARLQERLDSGDSDVKSIELEAACVELCTAMRDTP